MLVGPGLGVGEGDAEGVGVVDGEGDGEVLAVGVGEGLFPPSPSLSPLLSQLIIAKNKNVKHIKATKCSSPYLLNDRYFFINISPLGSIPLI
jgi:hypothetical protein